MPSTSLPVSDPTTPLRPRQAYPVSPDSPRRRSPAQQLVGVVVPRSRREASRDPLDFLDTQNYAGADEAPPLALSEPAPLPASSVDAPHASGSSAVSANGRRASARVQKKQEDEAAAAAERKRKRAERKAREAAEKAELQRQIDAGEIDPPAEGAKKRQRTSTSRPKTTKSSKTSQSSNSQSSHPRSSQPDSGERSGAALPSSIPAPPAADLTSSNTSSVSQPHSRHEDASARPQSSSGRTETSTPIKAAEQALHDPARASSAAQPTTPDPAPTSSGSSAATAPTTPAPRPLQASRSTPASSSRPSTPGPNGYKWKTGG